MHRRTFLAAAGSGLALGALGHVPVRAFATATPAPPPAMDAAAYRAGRRFVSTPFGDVAYVERGRGPAALFLHGFPLNSFQWRGVLPRLAPLRRCLAPDFLALGHTRVAPGVGVGPDTQVRMLLAFLDALGIERADVVANDSGGAVAQLLLARHPQRVRSLLLSNCDTEIECPPAAMRPVIELSRQGRYADAWLAPWLADPASARAQDGIGGMCYADPAHPTDEAVRAYFEPLLDGPRRKALVHRYVRSLAHNVLQGIGPLLARTQVPVRTVWGSADGIFSLAGARHLQQAFGQGRGVRMLPGSKLFWPEERPDVVAEEARRLWSAPNP